MLPLCIMTGTKSNELEKVLQRRISMPIKEKKPGTVKPNVPTNEVQLDESGFKILAMPKSEM